MDSQVDYVADEMFKGNFSGEGKSDIYLKLEGIEGESEDKGHAKEINVINFSMIEWQVGSSGKGGGSGASRASFEKVRFTCAVSKAGPKIFLACCRGDHPPTAVFTFRKSGGGQLDFMTVKLSDTVVKHYEQRLDDFDDGTKGIVEEVHVACAKVEVEYKPQNKDGSLGSPLSFAFDLTGK